MKRIAQAMGHIGMQDIQAWKKDSEKEGPEEEAHVNWSNRGRAEEQLAKHEQELWDR